MTSTAVDPSSALRTIQITGITVHLAERLERSLLIELNVDGTDSASVLLKQKDKPDGSRSLQKHLILREGSTLNVHIQEKHLLRRNEIIAHLNLAPESFLMGQDLGRSDGHSGQYRIHLKDNRKKIWLNFNVVLPIQQDRPDDLGQGLHPPENAPREQEQMKNPLKVASDYAVKKLNEFKNIPREQEQMNEPLRVASDYAVKKLNEFKTILVRIGKTKHSVDIALKFGRTISELYDVAKAVVGCVNIVYDQIKAKDANYKDLLALAESMSGTVNYLQTVKDIAGLSHLQETLAIFSKLMLETADFIETFVNRNGLASFLISPNKDEINDLKDRHTKFEQEFERGIKIEETIKVHTLTELQALEHFLLGGIRKVDPRATPCIEGTRTRILEDVVNNANELNGANIVWIRGAPGSGKSSVSLTAMSRLCDQGRLLTYFRFDRNEAATTTSTALWRHVAYDLARRLPSVRSRLLQLLRDNKVNLELSMAVFSSLIEVVLVELKDTPLDHALVIVIDALDECGGFTGRSSPDRQTLLQTLGRWPKLHKHFKLLVTSRDEGDIRRVLSSISVSIVIPSGNFLTDNPEAQASTEASNDIQKYLEGRFIRIAEPLPSLPPKWPGEVIIASMVLRAAGNFMWATTALNFIDSGLDPRDQLKSIMDDTPESLSMTPLYSLYSTILETSFGSFSSNSANAELLRAVLGTIVFAERPLDDIDYTKLPTSKPVSKLTVELIRERLHSVVGDGPTLRFVHKSFDDFLLSEECPPQYRIRIDETQSLLTRLCLTTMMTELRFNMCSLETSCVKNVEIPDITKTVSQGIPALVSYSCCFWADHLSHTSFSPQPMAAVKEVVFSKLLYWFEAMSLLEEINRVSPSLLSVLRWAMPGSDRDLNEFIRDARRFIGAFINPISQSAPHIYISALPFAPEQCSVSRRFLPLFPRLLELSTGKPEKWSSCLFTAENHTRAVYAVAFSSDEKYFVSGSTDHSVCIGDAETGNLIAGPFMTSSGVRSVFFSPDGRRIWASCWDGHVDSWELESGDHHVGFRAGGDYYDIIGCTWFNNGQNILSVSAYKGKVTLWDAETGEDPDILLKIPIGEQYSKVSFSSDHCYMAWAGSGESGIRMWDLVERIEVRGSSRSRRRSKHKKPISALSFSVDAHFAISGSKDGAIIIWDAKTGDAVGEPLITGKVTVDAVGYHHEKRFVISCSGSPGTVMVWNASTHEAVLGPLEGHSSTISTINLSRDGSRALSGSWDGTVRMWDLDSKGVPSEPRNTTEGHNGTVFSVKFSPCGSKLASVGYDNTIRVWDVVAGKPLFTHDTMLPFYDIIFSPDGNQILAFGSVDGILQVRNANTGKLILQKDLNDPGQDRTQISYVAFRKSDQRLVTCSTNGVVCIWSLEDGTMTEDPRVSSPQPQGPSPHIRIAALSPDGMTAVVRDENRNPRHYMWSTITRQTLPFIFTDNKGLGDQMVYSPSGRLLAFSSSGDGDVYTLRVWETQNGELIAGPSIIDGMLTRMAFSADERYIAFSYFTLGSNVDGTVIWIWDVHTGRLASGPWKRHTTEVMACDFSRDGERLASCSTDGQIQFWNTADLLGHVEEKKPTEPSDEGMQIQEGWVVDASGSKLFWVPESHRSRLFWPGNIAAIGGTGQQTELSMKKFIYGTKWAECFGGGM